MKCLAIPNPQLLAVVNKREERFRSGSRNGICKRRIDTEKFRIAPWKARDSNPQPHTGRRISNLMPLGLKPRENGTPSHVASRSPAVNQEIALDLQAVIDSWQDLPEAVKTGIVAMVKAAGSRG